MVKLCYVQIPTLRLQNGNCSREQSKGATEATRSTIAQHAPPKRPPKLGTNYLSVPTLPDLVLALSSNSGIMSPEAGYLLPQLRPVAYAYAPNACA